MVEGGREGVAEPLKLLSLSPSLSLSSSLYCQNEYFLFLPPSQLQYCPGIYHSHPRVNKDEGDQATRVLLLVVGGSKA